ncbi:MAG: hypothetical protein ABJG47_02170 [Ekhidna sp.]
MKYLTLILFTASLIFSCGRKPENATNSSSAPEEISLDSLKSQVLAIHDEVMPKIGELRKTRMELEVLADSLMEADSTNAKMFSRLATDLAAANEGMMNWMHQYDSEFDGTDDEIKEYLEGQKKSIQQVKEDMNGSLAAAKETLEQY